MTEHEARYILQKHSMLFNLIDQANYTVDASMAMVEEIHSALLFFEPNYHWDRTCGSCCTSMLKQANRHRLKFHKF